MGGVWVVLRTQLHRERQAAESVRARGVQAYLPLLPAPRSTGQSPPLFPGYVFASVDPVTDDLLRIRSAPGVAYVLPRGAPPAFLSSSVVEGLRVRVAERSAELARRQLRSGDRVTVTSGPFRWHDALFQRRLSGSGRVRILLELVHRSVGVVIEEAALRRVS